MNINKYLCTFFFKASVIYENSAKWDKKPLNKHALRG